MGQNQSTNTDNSSPPAPTAITTAPSNLSSIDNNDHRTSRGDIYNLFLFNNSLIYLIIIII